nr:uncharacterized protein LOC117441855 [Pseudochaenichthys georgianus]
MHVTIREGRSLPDLQRCTTCCEDFHCPFCASTVFQSARLSKVKAHLESHFNRAVLHEGYTIHRCALHCRPEWHFHCFYCQATLMRKADFIKHLALGKAKISAITPIIPDPATPIIPDPATPIIPDPSSQIQQPPSSQIQQPPSSQIHQPPSSQIQQPPSSQIHQPPSSQIQQPPSSQIQSINPIIPDPSTPIIPDPATPIIPDPSTPIIPDPSTPIIPDPATPIIPDPSTPIIPDPIHQPPSSQIQQPPSSQIQQPPSSQIQRPPSSQIQRPPIIPDPATPIIPDPATPIIPDPATPIIPDPATPFIPDPATPIIPDPATPIIPDPATPIIPDPATPIIPDPATPIIPDPATPIIPDPATPIIPDPATPIIPDPATPIIPDPATPFIPEGKMQRVRVVPVLKKKCPICHVLISKTKLKKHMERKHSAKPKDISSGPQLQIECIDPGNGVYAVHKAFRGASAPLHVQNKVWGENQYVSCENDECQVSLELAWRSGIKAYQCTHLESITCCSSYASPTELEEGALTEMVDNNWFGEDAKRLCLVRQNLARCNHFPLSVSSKAGTPQTTEYISVYEPTVSDYSRLGRVMVSYDTKTNAWRCPCAKTKMSCPHKDIAKWHLFQTQRELFRKVRSSEEVDGLSAAAEGEHGHHEADLGDVPYPPNSVHTLKGMARYILSHKKLPAVLPERLRLPSVEVQYPRHLVPEESTCQHCPGHVPLSDPVLVTHEAKILTESRIVNDVSTYCKACHRCGARYRYQEWKDGIHNFNDRILLDLPLCLTIRNMLQVHTAVSRVVQYLELTSGEQFPSADTVLQGYLHFEALTEHDYQYSCVSCGDHPPVVIMGLHRTSASHWSGDLERPPADFDGEVDMECFWDALSMERIGRGFVTSQQENPFAVPPTFHFWAPWIGRNTRRSNRVLNTEFAKVRPQKPAEVQEVTVTEERLREELHKQKVEVVRTLCAECGLESSGSRTDLLLRLSDEMKSKRTYDKVFQKIWAGSGGWAVIMCPCGIVYSIKCNFRAESPRDFTDILLSWKHMPNIVIYDFARGLATHMNLREPERSPFAPFDGRLMAPTADNIKRAKEGKLEVSLPWLDCKKPAPDPDCHPVTGSAEHYALWDRLHEDNAEDARDALRRLSLVPQLAGKLNDQVAEQLFARMKKNNYFLNTALPTTHLFLMRNIIHHHNVHKSSRTGHHSN